jgi:hypothetical protein
MDEAWAATVVALQEREEQWVDELLGAASERLRFGWTQGAFGETLAGERQQKADGDSVAFCLLGALASAARSLNADAYTLRRAERLVAEGVDTARWMGLMGDSAPASRWPRSAIMAWNDECERGKEEVVALVERALRRRVRVRAEPTRPVSPGLVANFLEPT